MHGPGTVPNAAGILSIYRLATENWSRVAKVKGKKVSNSLENICGPATLPGISRILLYIQSRAWNGVARGCRRMCADLSSINQVDSALGPTLIGSASVGRSADEPASVQPLIKIIPVPQQAEGYPVADIVGRFVLRMCFWVNVFAEWTRGTHPACRSGVRDGNTVSRGERS